MVSKSKKVFKNGSGPVEKAGELIRKSSQQPSDPSVYTSISNGMNEWMNAYIREGVALKEFQLINAGAIREVE